MGNICRSPSAEGFVRAGLERAGLADRVWTDSAGTHGYHLGQPPDSRAIRTAAEFGVDISDLRARRVQPGDLQEFDLVLAMDQVNLRALEQLGQGLATGVRRAELGLMMDYSARFGHLREVPDPYYGDLADFRYMCELLDDATLGLLESLSQRLTGDQETQAR